MEATCVGRGKEEGECDTRNVLHGALCVVRKGDSVSEPEGMAEVRYIQDDWTVTENLCETDAKDGGGP